jgi:hypothetical protein
MLRLTRKATVFPRVLPTFVVVSKRTRCGGSGRVHGHVEEAAELLKLQKRGQFPDEPVRITV